MFKTQLSSNLIPEKVVTAVVPLVTFFSWTAMPIVVTFFLIPLMFILVPYSLYTIYMAPLNISYDPTLIYIVSRKTEKIVTLKNITQIQPVSSYATLRKRWQISYTENGVEEELYFYPAEDLTVQQFIKAVRVQNPLVSGTN